MKANSINQFSPQELAAWNEFHEKRTLELKEEFPNIDINEIENKVWLEFLSFKYCLSMPSLFSSTSNLIDVLDANDFGPDSRRFLKCFSHYSVAQIPEEALVAQNVIQENKSPILSKKNKPLSLYNFFFKKKLEEYRTKHPMMKIQEISRLVGKEWHSLEKQKILEEYFIEFGSKPP